MSALVRYDLGSELDELRREVNQIFGNMSGMPALWSAGRDRIAPAMDTFERDGKLCLTLDLPGMSLDDIDVEVAGDRLVIRGSRTIDRKSEQDTWHRVERTSGSFERVVQLPQPIEAKDIDAQFQHGVLTMTLPLPESRSSRPERVAIKSTDA
jgi:HSP20 family protein